MSEIKKEYSYRTTDGKLHSGKGAGKKAESHQKQINFRKNIKEIVAEAVSIFDLKIRMKMSYWTK